jgi:hypothetical protein
VSSFGFLTRSDGEKRVSGREYHKLGSLLHDMSWSLLAEAFEPDTPAGLALMRRAFTWERWVLEERTPGQTADEDFRRRAELDMKTGSPRVRVNSPSGQSVANAFEVGINSTCASPVDAVALAMRIYGQAEVNAWVAGEDRLWLAKVIEQGLAVPFPPEFIRPHWDVLPPGSKLFSDNEHWKSHYDGWAEVVEHLRSNDREIVVLDYSVTDGFPGTEKAVWPAEPGKRFRRWWSKATDEQQWDASERGLMRITERVATSLQITPENLRCPGFGTTEAWTWAELAKAWRDSARI